jgi:tRNA pseudouridine38-40 synthase
MTNQRWKMTVEYDGTPFYGWQRQEKTLPTIQVSIEDAIFGFCGQHTNIHVAGRTDAGVHACGQVFHVDLPIRDRLGAFETIKAINAHLFPKPITIIDAEKVLPSFHARFGAANKLYKYRILRRSGPPTIDANRMWHFRRDLNIDLMRDAATHLLGKHDFSTFRDSSCQAKSPIKTLDRLDIETKDVGFNATEIIFYVEGRSFLHHQVRNMVGTLTLIGSQRWQVNDIKTALLACDRQAGGPTAPAYGLYLMRVDYLTENEPQNHADQ